MLVTGKGHPKPQLLHHLVGPLGDLTEGVGIAERNDAALFFQCLPDGKGVGSQGGAPVIEALAVFPGAAFSPGEMVKIIGVAGQLDALHPGGPVEILPAHAAVGRAVLAGGGIDVGVFSHHRNDCPHIILLQKGGQKGEIVAIAVVQGEQYRLFGQGAGAIGIGHQLRQGNAGVAVIPKPGKVAFHPTDGADVLVGGAVAGDQAVIHDDRQPAAGSRRGKNLHRPFPAQPGQQGRQQHQRRQIKSHLP